MAESEIRLSGIELVACSEDGKDAIIGVYVNRVPLKLIFAAELLPRLMLLLGLASGEAEKRRGEDPKPLEAGDINVVEYAKKSDDALLDVQIRGTKGRLRFHTLRTQLIFLAEGILQRMAPEKLRQLERPRTPKADS